MEADARRRVRRVVSPPRSAMGERVGGYIYGTILVMATVVAGAKSYEHRLGHVALLVFVTTVVFWVAHVYAHSLAYSISSDERLSPRTLFRIAHRESSIIEAAVLPVVALLLGHWNVTSDRTAVWIALACGLGVLATQGIAVARVERLGRLGTLVIVAVNLGLGLVLVGLKLWVGH